MKQSLKIKVLGFLQHRHTGAGITGMSLLGLLVIFILERAGNNGLSWSLLGMVSVGWYLQIHSRKVNFRFNRSVIEALEKGMRGEDYPPIRAIPGLRQTFILKENFDKAMLSLKGTNGLVTQVASSLAEHASDISHTASDIAQQMNTQVGETSEITELVERLQSVFATSVSAAQETVELSSKSESEGNSGKLVMTEAMSSVAALNDSIVSAGSMIGRLGDESSEIGGIVNVIKGVAEQTNLLALNAAIEAARAGEQGRGFAVVADEVRNLASKTQDSTSEIEAIIEKIVNSVNETSETVNRSVELAEQSDEAIEGVIISYSELVGYLAEVSVLGRNVAEATQHEAATAQQVFNRLQDIQEIGHTTETSSIKMADASKELHSLGEQLEQLAKLSTSAPEQNNQDLEQDVDDDLF